MFRNGLQGGHIVVLLVIIVLLFGASRLPGLARSVGESLRIFKKEIKDVTHDDAPAGTAQPAAPVAPTTTPTTPAAPVAPVPPVVQSPVTPMTGAPVTPAQPPADGGTTTDPAK